MTAKTHVQHLPQTLSSLVDVIIKNNPKNMIVRERMIYKINKVKEKEKENTKEIFRGK